MGHNHTTEDIAPGMIRTRGDEIVGIGTEKKPVAISTVQMISMFGHKLPNVVKIISDSLKRVTSKVFRTEWSNGELSYTFQFAKLNKEYKDFLEDIVANHEEYGFSKAGYVDDSAFTVFLSEDFADAAKKTFKSAPGLINRTDAGMKAAIYVPTPDKSVNFTDKDVSLAKAAIEFSKDRSAEAIQKKTGFNIEKSRKIMAEIERQERADSLRNKPAVGTPPKSGPTPYRGISEINTILKKHMPGASEGDLRSAYLAYKKLLLTLGNSVGTAEQFSKDWEEFKGFERELTIAAAKDNYTMTKKESISNRELAISLIESI